MNWLDAEASMLAVPCAANGGVRVKGSASRDTWAPSCRSPSRSGAMGRSLACGSPVNVDGPSASMATGGTNLMTVPASPQSMSVAPRKRSGGVTTRASPRSTMSTPSALSAPIIRAESRDSSAPTRVLGPSASAARMSARLVSDFEPGTTTSPATGDWVKGRGWVIS